METATHTAPDHPALKTATLTAAPPNATQTLRVTVTYVLSEAGRKASLLAGGDGRALQRITVEVPVNRLHLVAVDPKGVARLKLRPRYELNDDQRIVRVDTPPTYDTPPSLEDLFRAAARNHELEGTYLAQRTAARGRRRDGDRELRHQLAQTFLSDPTQRALVHPAPSSRRCYLATEHGRILFDIRSDEGLAREVPAEANRRFRADLRVRRERNLQERAAQLGLHEEKKRFIAEWIAEHGTEEQKSRQAAGMLPMDEAIEAIADQAFAAAADHPRYARDGAERLQAHLRQFPQYADVVVTPADVVVTGVNAVKATAGQWAVVQDLQNALPEATVTLRVHKIAWKRDPQAPSVIVFGAIAARKIGPFTLRREYAVPDLQSEVSASTGELVQERFALG